MEEFMLGDDRNVPLLLGIALVVSIVVGIPMTALGLVLNDYRKQLSVRTTDTIIRIGLAGFAGATFYYNTTPPHPVLLYLGVMTATVAVWPWRQEPGEGGLLG